MPTPSHGKAAVLFHDGFRLSRIVSKFSQAWDVGEAEYTAIEDIEGQFLQGKPVGKVTADGFLDVTPTTGWDARNFEALQDGTHQWNALPLGVAAGQPAYLMLYQITSAPRPFDTAAVVALNTAGTVTGPFGRGEVLSTLTTATETGPQAGREVGETEAGELLLVHVWLVDAEGEGSVTVAIDQSEDNGSGDAYAAISGLSGSLTTIGQSLRFTTTAATEAWKRSNVTALSGFTSVTFMVTIATAVAS